MRRAYVYRASDNALVRMRNSEIMMEIYNGRPENNDGRLPREIRTYDFNKVFYFHDLTPFKILW